MENLCRTLGWKLRLIPAFLATLCFLSVAAFTQQPATRIATEIDSNDRVPIKGTKSPMARVENDAGRVPGETKLQGINIFFSRSAEQDADLDALIAAQQDSNSPLYHKWATPEEFGARFGLGDSDIAKVQEWLEQHGFTVNSVSPSKSHITFSGTIAQIEATFGAELHHYDVGGKKHFTPSADLAIPAALSSIVQAVKNLSSFKPHPQVKFRTPQLAPRPEFTSGQTGNHFLTPKDVATVYDINPAYDAGYTGAGQSIAVDVIAQTPSLGLSNGSASYTFSSTSAGSHTISGTYSGDSTFASSSGSVSVTVTATKTFTLSATNVTVSAWNTSTSTVTITPKNGYTSTVAFTVASSPSLTDGCFSLPNTTVSGSSAVTASLTVRTNSSACASGALARPAVGQQNFVRGALRTLGNDFRLLSAFKAGLALAGLLLVAVPVYHFGCHRLGMIAGVFLLVAIGFVISVISGCGGGGYGSNAAKGTYTVTIVGRDTDSSSITASTTMTLTID